jgi:hypothetical protein
MTQTYGEALPIRQGSQVGLDALGRGASADFIATLIPSG